MSKLRKFTQEELNKILENHQRWLEEDCKGWEDMKADLSYADLSGANLSNANLRYVDLYNANLSNANLYKADLYSADLRFANLYKANLEDSNLRFANLYKANLEDSKINLFFACPSHGAFIAWKKADGKIVKLQILEESKRLSATTNKCRCDKALVLEIQDLDGNKLDIESVPSIYDKDFIYKVGEIVCVNGFNEDR